MVAYGGLRGKLTYVSMILSAVSAILSVLPFYYIWLILKEVIEVMPNYGLATGIVANGWMALLFTVASIVVYILSLMCSHLSAFRVSRNIRIKLMGHISTLPPGSFDTTGSGNARRVIQDAVESIHTHLAHQVPDKAGSVMLPFCILAMLFVFDWRLGIASLLPVVLAILMMVKMASGKDIEENMRKYGDAMGNINKEAVEFVRGVSVVKTFQQTVDTFLSFKRTIEEFGEFMIKYTRWCRPPMVAFVVFSNSAFAFLILAGLIITGYEGITDKFILDFLFYVIFTPLISVLMMRVLFSTNEKRITGDAMSRIDAILGMQPLSEPSEPKVPDTFGISFEGVTFSYEGADTTAVKNLDLSVPSGKITALIGPSGSGKSTVAGLACRFWDPQEGKVSIGGIDVREIGSAKLADLMSFVFQSSSIFKDTLLNNVRLGRPDATAEQVEAALAAAQCQDIIAKLPDGLDTMMGPGGMYLSGGEVQRIAIARAIVKDAPIVVFDEATAFADPENEHLVQKAFTNLAKDKTVLIIAHRLTTVKNADRICVMEGGRIVEMGAHDALLETGGRYNTMWNDYQTALSWKIKGVAS
ncbi:MAG: ABC transporter ATP-binding protein [Candidatus Methanomethylophilaceae archaeon]|nr:ABC transporter ATP-binding protein [Candidatus Methanomethylophilaceae archaeon]